LKIENSFCPSVKPVSGEIKFASGAKYFGHLKNNLPHG
jgi:hypothetical protein